MHVLYTLGREIFAFFFFIITIVITIMIYAAAIFFFFSFAPLDGGVTNGAGRISDNAGPHRFGTTTTRIKTTTMLR